MEGPASDRQRYKLIISGILFIWSISVFTPGAYSIDTWNQWKEVSSNKYDDWYGTGLATTWRFLWLITGNYISLFVFQMTLYWLFFTALLWRISITGILYWLTILGALFFLFIPQYIMRDSVMVLAWANACLLLLYGVRSEKHRRKLTIFALLLIAYGFWVRLNMIVALAPLVYIAVILLAPKPIALGKRLALTAGIVAVMFLAYPFITYKIQHASRMYPEYKLKLLDIIGVTKLSGENCFPDIIRRYPYFHLDSILSQYSPGGIDDIYWPANRKSPFPDPGLDSVYVLTTRSWQHAILHHPFYYLENRLNGFLYYLRLRRQSWPGGYYKTAAFWIEPGGPLPASHEPTALKKGIRHFYTLFDSLIFDPWFWFLLNIVGLTAFIVRYRRSQGGLRMLWLAHCCIQLSGVLFVVSQIPVYQSDRDFRFTYWNIFVAFIALIGLFSRPKIKEPDECPAL